jgi:HEAT repeat protein
MRPSKPAIAQGGSATFAPQEARTKEAAEVLSALEKNPAGPAIGDTLAVLNRQVEGALRAGKMEQAVEIVAGVVAVEKSIDDAALRRQYAIALKRMMTKPLLDALSKLVQDPEYETRAGTVLQRAGADGAEVLLDLLVTSATIQERRGVYSILMQMKESADQLVHMLNHPQWYVVRNVADLMGDLGLDSAVPALAKALEHSDERVRKAVALALAKIGTRQAAEPLRRALRDKDPGVRMQVPLGVGGRKASPLAMPLVVALEEEKDATVGKELILALGRIASPDAVQALIKIAQPAGKLFGRKPTALRLIAVEALRLSATPAALGTLQGLSNDGDKQVRAAAQQALQDLRAKPT